MGYVPLRSVDGINRSSTKVVSKQTIIHPLKVPKSQRRRSKRTIVYALVALLIGLIVGYLGNGHLFNKRPVSKTVVIGIGRQLVNNNNDLGISAFKQVYPGQQSVLLSLSGLSMATSLLEQGNNYHGAKLTADMKQAYQALDSYINSLYPNQLSIKNSLWIKRSDSVPAGFMSIAKKYYLSNVFRVNNLNGNLKQLNNWLAGNGGGLLPAVSVAGNNTNLFLADASIFKFNWFFRFNNKLTKTANFYLSNGSFKAVPYLNQLNTFAYYQNSMLQAVNIPIGENQNLSMVIFMPSDINSFVTGLSGASLNNIFDQMVPENVDLFMPKFSLGSNNAFILMPNGTLQPATNSILLNQSEIYQESYLDVSSTGYNQAPTESLNGANIMIINHPFVFAIRDNTTGLILFMGSVFNP